MILIVQASSIHNEGIIHKFEENLNEPQWTKIWSDKSTFDKVTYKKQQEH